MTLPTSTFAQCVTGGSQGGVFGSGGFIGYGDALRNLIEWTINAVYALDPNALSGPKGFAEKQFVSVKDKMAFTIQYENSAEFATAPAQNVAIHLPVDPKIDINSFRLGSFGFGQFNFTVPENTSYYTTRLDLRDSLGIFVDVTAGIDIVNNEAFWILRSIDPSTGLAPTDVLKGFLPVNDTASNGLLDSLPGKGEGYVNFFVSPMSGVVTGDSVSATARIVFDVNDAIPTNIWTNTIDAVAPASRITAHGVTGNTITLNWTGQDDLKGSGLRDYALYVSEDSSTFKLYQKNITANAIAFTGTPGSTYCFFTLATDNTGNQETLKKTCDLSVELNGLDVALPVKWLYFTGAQQANNAYLQWATTSETNVQQFTIERSLDGTRFTAIGMMPATNTGNQTSNYHYLDIDAMLLPSKNIYYRLKEVDKDGKYIYSVIVSLPVKQGLLQANVNAYPNPFDRLITLKIQTVKPTDQTDKVELYSMDGKLLYQRKLDQIGNTTVLLQDLPHLTPGSYALRIFVAGKFYSIKMKRQ